MKISQSVARIFFWLAAVLAAVAFIYAAFTFRFVLGSETAQAEVVEYEQSDRSIMFGVAPGGGMHFFPVLRFSDTAGQQVTFTSDRGTQSRRFEIGAQIAVRYSRDTPEKARIDSVWGVWGAVLVIIASAALFAACALVFRYRFDEA